MFPDFEDTETYLFESLTYKIFSKFLFDSNGLYFEFVERQLEIRNGKLWIKGYHGQKQDPRKINNLHLNDGQNQKKW